MDTIGARLLAARLRAGVRPGTMIELISDSTEDSPLRPGDYGIVRDLKQDGSIIVEWERGFLVEIHPSLAEYRPLGIGTPHAP